MRLSFWRIHSLIPWISVLLVCSLQAQQEKDQDSSQVYRLRAVDPQQVGSGGDDRTDATLWFEVVRYPIRSDTTEYEVLDTFAAVSSIKPVDSVTVAYFVRVDDCGYMIHRQVEPPFAIDTILECCDTSSCNWIWTLASWAYQPATNLLCCSCFGRYGDSGRPWPSSILRIAEGRRADTLGSIGDGLFPVISSDGSEVFFETLKTHGDNWLLDVLVYDVETGDTSTPVGANCSILRGYRPNKSVALHYIKADTATWSTNIWKYVEGEGEIQVTALPDSTDIECYWFVEDSLAYTTSRRPSQPAGPN